MLETHAAKFVAATLPCFRLPFLIHALKITSDLLGRAMLARNWARIGTPDRVRLDPHAELGAALVALARFEHLKRK